MLEFINDHSEVIDDLKSQLRIKNVPKVNTIKIKRTIISNSEFGAQYRLLNNYVCVCGHKMDKIDNVSTPQGSNRILDTHLLFCSKCSHQERISFSMVRKALSSADPLSTTSDRYKMI
jgi:hypothetical protein